MKFTQKCILAVVACVFIFSSVYAKKDRKRRKSDDTVKMMVDTVKTLTQDTTKEKPQFKTIKEVTKKCTKSVGLFPIYQDSTDGKTYIEISEDKIGKEYIYFAYVLDGYLNSGYARGGYKDNTIFKIEKYFDRIDFVLQNTNYYFDKNNALSKAKNANINEPLFLSEKIVAKTGNNYLIEADDLFMSESITQIKPSKRVGEKPDDFSLGTLNKKKSKYLAIKNYPKNTNVSVEYVFDNPAPMNYGTTEVTDARFVSVKLQHSLIEVPQNNFKPRADDPRVGYFMEEINDQTSSDATPWKDLIHRWNLEKKNPNEKLSEPVKPIVWWIENTTPLEFRPIIKNAVLAWNEAFEQAGFKNAVECKIQPDTASWDADDIEHNVLRWTSSPRPPFGGYGPSFVNPRTGEILGADIMLEFIYLTNRLPYEKLYDIAALDNYNEAQPLQFDYCSAGEAMHQNILYGNEILNAYGFSDVDKDEFIKQALYDLVLHEVGHTMGLMHNFIGSQFHSIDEMHDPTLGATIGLTASVMDYTIPNISENKDKQGLFFDTKPGLYDKWAIQYGYSTYDNDTDEAKGLADILAQSTKKEYRFRNDADDMRSVGKGIDPRGNIYDMSDDAISYAINNIEMAKDALTKIKEKYTTENKSYHELRRAYLILTGNQARSLNVIDRYIGGVYVDRNFAGQEINTKPFTPVPYQDQKRAMKALVKYAFSKNAFDVSDDIYNYLQMQRRGYDFRKETEDPKIHERILNIQKGVLDHLTNNTVLQRLTDTKLYGNKYSANSMLRDLTNGIFIQDLGASVSTIRQNLQTEYVNRLIKMAAKNSTYAYTSQAAAFGELQRILKWMETGYGSNLDTQAHRAHLAFLINEALDTKQ
ncbi:MAG: zinc-dependent metalloprotease [Chitinophagales bacterium]|nr:zinc-dependent metalloprotease [Bacteroidota bacterium]